MLSSDQRVYSVYEEAQMEDEKKREMTKRGRGRKKERETYTGGPCQRGGAAKGDEGGGIRWETRMEKERKDVKQSNDEMHFPLGPSPLATLAPTRRSPGGKRRTKR